MWANRHLQKRGRHEGRISEATMFCDERSSSSGPLGDRTLPGADVMREWAQHSKQSLVWDSGRELGRTPRCVRINVH
jgi:hypothetical protein